MHCSIIYKLAMTSTMKDVEVELKSACIFSASVGFNVHACVCEAEKRVEGTLQIDLISP